MKNVKIKGTKVPLKKIGSNEKRLEWIPFAADAMVNDIVKVVRCVLERNSLTADEIDHFMFKLYVGFICKAGK